jgi:hypothetical protein
MWGTFVFQAIGEDIIENVMYYVQYITFSAVASWP